MAHKTQGTIYYQFLTKDMTEDTNKQSDEEVDRKRSGMAPSTGASVPWN